jgi:hypothetical protein
MHAAVPPCAVDECGAVNRPGPKPIPAPSWKPQDYSKAVQGTLRPVEVINSAERLKGAYQKPKLDAFPGSLPAPAAPPRQPGAH